MRAYNENGMKLEMFANGKRWATGFVSIVV